MLELIKKIKTDRLTIIPFTEKYITSRYISWLNNDETMRYSEQRHKEHTFESCKIYIESFINTPNTLWAIEETINRFGHIGNINVYIDIHNKIADVGILIGENKAQSRGYGYEAFKEITEYLFKNADISKITAGTVSSNLPMVKKKKKMKMKEDGIRKQHYIIDGKKVDVMYMALFGEDMKREKNNK
ncbi:MAG: GNAT family N-acetyltransferase [Deltaproteobacteria bacterium]|nr:GNAT family N-acetyltransferase [Deltaproteobacteria bacterium]